VCSWRCYIICVWQRKKVVALVTTQLVAKIVNFLISLVFQFLNHLQHFKFSIPRFYTDRANNHLYSKAPKLSWVSKIAWIHSQLWDLAGQSSLVVVLFTCNKCTPSCKVDQGVNLHFIRIDKKRYAMLDSLYSRSNFVMVQVKLKYAFVLQNLLRHTGRNLLEEYSYTLRPQDTLQTLNLSSQQ